MAGAGHRSLHLNNGRMMTMMGEGPQRAARGIHEKKRRSAMAIYFNASKQKAHSLAPPSHVNVSSMSVKWAEQRSISGIIIIIISSYFFGLPSLFSSLFVLCFLFPFFFCVVACAACKEAHWACVCLCSAHIRHAFTGSWGGELFPPYQLEFHGMWWPA